MSSDSLNDIPDHLWNRAVEHVMLCVEESVNDLKLHISEQDRSTLLVLSLLERDLNTLREDMQRGDTWGA